MNDLGQIRDVCCSFEGIFILSKPGDGTQAHLYKYKTMHKVQICYSNFLDNKLFILHHDILFLFEKVWSIKLCCSIVSYFKAQNCHEIQGCKRKTILVSIYSSRLICFVSTFLLKGGWGRKVFSSHAMSPCLKHVFKISSWNSFKTILLI